MRRISAKKQGSEPARKPTSATRHTPFDRSAASAPDLLLRRAEYLGHHVRPNRQSQDSRLQRQPVYHKPLAGIASDKTEEQGLKQAKLIDKQVDKAYEEFMGGNYKGASDAQIELYLLRKHQLDNGEKTMHPSTAAGYVIEGKVNSVIESWKGVSTQVTDALPGTRPDVSIDLGDGVFALVDITASNSAGHILNKKGNWLNHKNIPVVIESVYPSIDFSTMKKIKLSAEQLEQVHKRIAEDKEAKALAQAELQAQMEQAHTERQNVLINKLSEAMMAFRVRKRGNRTELEIKKKGRTQALWNACGLVVEINTRAGFTDLGSPKEWDAQRIPYADWIDTVEDRTELRKKAALLLGGLNRTLRQLN